MTAQTEHALNRALRDHITANDPDGDQCALVIRSLTISEVIYASHDGAYPPITSTGDLPPWAAAGLIAQAKAVTDANLLNHFQPDDEEDQ